MFGQSALSNIAFVMTGPFGFGVFENGCAGGGPVAAADLIIGVGVLSGLFTFEGRPSFGLSSNIVSFSNFKAFRSLQCLSSVLIELSAYRPTSILTVDLESLF